MRRWCPAPTFLVLIHRLTPSVLGSAHTYAFVTGVTNALSQSAYSQYDYNTGRPVDVKDTNGIVTSGYSSDALDRPTQVIRAVGTGAVSQTSFSYDDEDRVITTTSDHTANNDSHPLKSQIVYDGLGRTTEQRTYEGTDSNGEHYIATKQEYDPLGRSYRISNPFRPVTPDSESAIWTTTAFDALSRVLTVTTPDSAVVTTSYSGNTVTVTDQAGKARKSVTDGLGRLTSVYEDPSSLNYLTSYSYDVLDDLLTVTQGSQTRTFVYDSLKRLTSATNPESGTVSYVYDGNGNLTSKTDALSRVTNFAYDALNRVTSKTYSNDGGVTPPVSYYYDSASLPSGAPASFNRGYSTGRLVAVTYGTSSSNGDYNGYDELGRVVRQVQQTDGVNYLTEATYYLSSALATETYPSVPGASDRRTVSYTPDAAGRLASLSSSATSYAAAAGLSSISYKPHGGLESETLGNSLIHQMSYNTRLQATAIKLGTSGNPTSVLDLTYNYGTTDNNGNVKSHVNTIGSLAITDTFSYDALNRISSTVETTTSGSGWTENNSYDRYGNRGGGSLSLTFNAPTNRITTSGYTYDAAGNLTNDGTHAYTFDAENKIKTADSTAIAYTYDGEGRRVRKVVSGGENTRFIYGIGGALVAEFSGSSGNLQKEYISGGGILAVIDPSAGTRYTTSDHLGSPRVVTNSSGNVVSRHDYMPFGVELGAGTAGRTTGMGYGATDGIRQQFTQKERDNETGLDYFLSRYYSSTQGRFTSPDPMTASARATRPQSWNRYAYCYNNPARFVDPDGMDIQFLNQQATDYVLGTLPEDIRDKVKDAIKDGTLNAGALNQISSKDQNFLDLKEMVDNKNLTEVNTDSGFQNQGEAQQQFYFKTAQETKKDFIDGYAKDPLKLGNTRAEAESLASNMTFEQEGTFGYTQLPNQSPSGHLRITVSDGTGAAAKMSLEERVATMGHELYVHGRLYLEGKPFGHGDKGGPTETQFRNVEERSKRNFRGSPTTPSFLKPRIR